jgi:hypothetical protein
MSFPKRIFDLHTHLFNARYVPLASIIADKMGKDESNLANHVARLIEALTGSSYPDTEPTMALESQDKDKLNQYLPEQLWNITKYELLVTIGSLEGIDKGVEILQDYTFAVPTFDLLRSSELMSIIKDLSNVDYASEGWTGSLPDTYAIVVPHGSLDVSMHFGDFIRWAEGVVKKALWVITRLMDPNAWGKAENYPEFFLTMLKSEEQILKELFAGYGHDLPPLQVAHYMMDMQMAYKGHKSPYYPFYPVQLNRMQELQRKNPARVFGFSAFDPRRGKDKEEWEKIAEDSLAKGFVGFKFYPAMGYKPTGNKPTDDEPVDQNRIDSFFDFCVKKDKDVPIFAHCTPTGFQTRYNKGGYAHPKYWREVLENPKWSNLRLCLGHAGGEERYKEDMDMCKDDKLPGGWMAGSDEEWNAPDNFARIVAELCTTYPNVYCDFGHILPLLEPENLKIENLKIFIANIDRARKAAKESQRPYELLDKMAYGSDWHMVAMIDKTREYLEVFLEIMNREAYRSYLDKFFWQNAYKFLKLVP